MPSLRTLVRLSFAATLFFLISSTARSQITTIGDDTSVPIQGAGHDYIKMLDETVNPANGSVSLRIQIPVPKARGITIPFGFNYDTNGVNHLVGGSGGGEAFWRGNASYLSQGGWSYSVPQLTVGGFSVTDTGDPTCQYVNGYMFQDPNGGRHALGVGVSSLAYNQVGTEVCDETVVLTGGDAQVTATLKQYAQGDTNPTATVFAADGTTYYFPDPEQHGVCCGGGYTSLPTYIEDRNGNKVNITDLNNGSFTMTDTLGRTALSVSGFGPSGSTNTVTVSGTTGTYQITWETVNASYAVPRYVVYTNPGYDTCGGVPGVSNTQVVIKSILLPNGQQYQFSYYDGTWGLIEQITYPTGATVAYTWKSSDNYSEFIEYAANGGSSIGCKYQYSPPVVATRTVSFNGSTLTQAYTYNTAWASGNTTWNTKTTTVTSTDSVLQKTNKTVYNYVSGNSGEPNPAYSYFNPFDTAAQTPVESSVQYYDWGSTNVLKTDAKTWYDSFDLGSETVTIAPSASSNTTYCYVGTTCVPNSSPAQLQYKSEYDFGGQLLRKATYAYQAFSNTPGVINDRPCTVVVSNSSGTTVAETDYLYDGTASTGTPCSSYTPQALPGTGSYTNHDETNFGTSSTTPRGNATTVIRKCLQSCANAITTYSYDETGHVISSIDPDGNPTTYIYADSYTTLSGTQNVAYTPTGNPTNAFLTTIKDALGHLSTFTYDYNNSQLTMAKDQNDINAGRAGTTYLYNDPFARPKQINYPDNGQTTMSYNDAGLSPTVTTSRLVNSSNQYLQTVTTMDGLGHVVESQVTGSPTSDPDCATGDITATSYYASGNVHTTSNPYCSTSDPTYGVTTYFYDGVNRTCLVVPPTGTLPSGSNCPTTQPGGDTLTLYSGRATAAYDEGNGTQSIERISQVDGLGRLTSLCEVAAPPFVVPSGNSNSSLIGQNGTPASCGLDISGSGFLTTYGYDALDNLLQVNQGTMAARTFTYDSLSRLMTASNPESGTLNYTYDAASNLHTKTAPAPNQTGTGTVITTYAYDALNRLLTKSYNDGKTPTTTFEYDSASNFPSFTNTVGRRVAAWSGAPGIGTYTEYDPMGRVAETLQYTPLGGNNAYSVGYTYDYLGDIMTQGDGYFHTYTFSYNPVARLTGITSSFSNSGEPATLLSGVHYNAAGQVTSDTLGTSEVETYTYTHRNQLQAETTKLSATQTYAYSVTFAPDGDVTGSTDSVNGNWSYSYDQFNRLVCSNLTTNGTCASPTSGTPTYSYDYDRFGNRWQQNGPYTMLLTFTGNNPANPANNNRMDGYTYDAAGNLLKDSVSFYTYDAENRIIEVQTGSSTGPVLATYEYNADGQRVHRTGVFTDTCDSTGVRDYAYDLSGHWILEVNTGGTYCKGEIYAGGRHYVTDVDGNSFFDHSDWLGTVRLRNSFQFPNTFTTCTSLPFGDALTCSGTDQDTIHFTGKERDSESGLDNFGARYNSSSMGRFMSPDPVNLTWKRLINPGNTLNKYAYAANNPLLYVDPNGKDITVFYRQPSGAAGDAGHVLLAVTNQQTGQVRFADYYPKGAKGFTPAPGEMNQGETSDRLKQHAALTIRTTPEIAQKLIDRIDALSPPNQTPDFMIPFSDCVVVCADLLNIAGINVPSALATPEDVWSTLYGNYSAEAQSDGQLKMGLSRYQPGKDFGVSMSAFPRGTDPFYNLQLLYLLADQQRNQKPPRACVTTNDSASGTSTTTCD